MDEETYQTKVADGEKAIVGGMIVDKTIKYTKNNKTMAFITLEDLVGTLEVIIFPKDYEKNSRLLNVDDKVFIRGEYRQRKKRMESSSVRKSILLMIPEKNCGSSSKQKMLMQKRKKNCFRC